jgi:hypothetical protein
MDNDEPLVVYLGTPDNCEYASSPSHFSGIRKIHGMGILLFLLVKKTRPQLE